MKTKTKPEGLGAALELAGGRSTKTRRNILTILSGAEPLAALEIKERLSERRLNVNKTTVYRELSFLLTKQVISEVIFNDGLKRYELKPSEHGHHIICLSCHRIKRVLMGHDLGRQEQKIERNLKFKIINHSLEFYGLCQKCQANSK